MSRRPVFDNKSVIIIMYFMLFNVRRRSSVSFVLLTLMLNMLF